MLKGCMGGQRQPLASHTYTVSKSTGIVTLTHTVNKPTRTVPAGLLEADLQQRAQLNYAKPFLSQVRAEPEQQRSCSIGLVFGEPSAGINTLTHEALFFYTTICFSILQSVCTTNSFPSRHSALCFNIDVHSLLACC